MNLLQYWILQPLKKIVEAIEIALAVIIMASVAIISFGPNLAVITALFYFAVSLVVFATLSVAHWIGFPVNAMTYWHDLLRFWHPANILPFIITVIPAGKLTIEGALSGKMSPILAGDVRY